MLHTGQSITTYLRRLVTLNGGLVREYPPKSPKKNQVKDL